MEGLNKEQLTLVLQSLFDDGDDIINAVLQESDDEEELLVKLLYHRKTGQIQKVKKDFLSTVVPKYSEHEFRTNFRIKRALFESLTQKFEVSDIYQNLRPDKRCSTNKHLAVFLWFAGHEMCSFRDLAKRFSLSISTISAIIERTAKFLSGLAPSEIKWPTDDEKQQSAAFFESRTKFSKAFGCIGMTRIVIDRPNECDDEYKDKKGNASVCLQAVCNGDRKFISVFVGYPGSSHESHVYENSSVCHKVNNCGEYYILGDSSLPCSNNLVTPYRDAGHMTHAQRTFNEKLNFARLAIGDTLSILKQRFPQLNCVKLRDMSKICHFVRACCVLHNMADNDDLEFSMNNAPEPGSEYSQYGETARGNVVRDAICQDLQDTSLSKTVTNKKQLEILVSYMETFPDIARRICIKKESTRWQALAAELNSHGPPERTWLRWIKIWHYLKHYIKKKRLDNMERLRSTGRHKKLHTFNHFEKRVIALLKLDNIDMTDLDPECSFLAPETTDVAVDTVDPHHCNNDIEIKIEVDDTPAEVKAPPVTKMPQIQFIEVRPQKKD